MLALQDRQPAAVRDASPSPAEEHNPAANHEQLKQAKPSADSSGQPTDTQQVSGTNRVTHQQMQDSGFAGAFAEIMEAIPDHVKQHASTQSADSTSVPQSDRSQSQPVSGLTDDAHSSEVHTAVAAAMDKVAEQQQQQAVSLDGGAAYPEHAAQVGRPAGVRPALD